MNERGGMSDVMTFDLRFQEPLSISYWRLFLRTASLWPSTRRSQNRMPTISICSW